MDKKKMRHKLEQARKDVGKLKVEAEALESNVPDF